VRGARVFGSLSQHILLGLAAGHKVAIDANVSTATFAMLTSLGLLVPIWEVRIRLHCRRSGYPRDRVCPYRCL
jgi:hypothetical protein